MPIGIQRLNDPHPQPSSQIVFIKPLPGQTSKYAQDFLERIAAICHPIMKANHLSIMTLEEHEPNPEFIGRNFNAGEIIQLVLRAPYSGHWLSFRSVQMVMMHELAHCMQMNHSKAFWKVRNQFADELKKLWGKDYTGDGLWGRGQTLLSGEYDTGNNMENEVLPRNLCGGTFRSSRRGKRKRNGGGEEKKTETYAERQQRRIAKKFGVNGEALGGDQEIRVNLEKGQKIKGKPRVANSSRGRELRVAAALARFGQQKEEAKEDESDAKAEANEDEESGSGTEDDYEEVEDGDKAFDLDGSRMRDGAGRRMVRVCEDEDQDDIDVKQEMDDLHQLDDVHPASRQPDKPTQQLKAAKPVNLDDNSGKGECETPVLSNTNPTTKKTAATDRPPTSTPKSQTAREHSTPVPTSSTPPRSHDSGGARAMPARTACTLTPQTAVSAVSVRLENQQQD